MAVSLLFTGHMIDKPRRPKPRFPPELEQAAAARIGQAVASWVQQASHAAGSIMGFASGAMGGDILFHEQCRSKKIPTTLVLPYPPEVFVRKSVRGIPDSDWERRFWQVWNDTPEAQRQTMDLSEADEAYGKCNKRLLKLARQHGRVHLIALWDRGSSDGPGGTADLVGKASKVGETEIIEPESLQATP